jgi:hypothetical protein
MLWNLAFHAAKLASRGISSFANSEAGQKLGDKTAEVLDSTRDKIAESVTAYRATRPTSASHTGRLRSGQKVVVKSSGKAGVVVRYLLENELGGDPHNSSESNLVLLELLEYRDELSRYLFTSASGCQVID